MEKTRLFIGSLPHEIDENAIRNRFSKYGDVLSVDLKHRYGGLSENDIISTFAFVDLQSSQDSVAMCLKKLSKKKWLGKEITIQLAKESVLSRLENERKTNMKNKKKEIVNISPNMSLLNGHDVKVGKSKDESKDSLTPIQNMKKVPSMVDNSSGILNKLENFSDVWKDCDVVSGQKMTKLDDSDFCIVPGESFNSEKDEKKLSYSDSNLFENNEHKIGSKTKSHVNEISLLSEERRQRSVEEMKKVYDQRKVLIKKALSSIDSGCLNKKIVFGDDDVDNNDVTVMNNSSSEMVGALNSGNKLFDEESEDEGEVQSFRIKQQFEGEKGKKLYQLQSKFGNDSRFFMDERFYEGDEEESNAVIERIEENTGSDNNECETTSDEVKKQLQILQSIVGDRDVMKQRKKQKVDKTSAAGIRFDPSMPSHEKFIMKPSDISEVDVNDKTKKSKRKQKEKEDKIEDDEEELVSTNKPDSKALKGTSYEVADELKETFKSTEKSSFTFSELFKSSSGNIDLQEDTLMSSKTVSSSTRNNVSYNNFRDDRFGGNFNDEKPLDKNENVHTEKRSASLWNENFFYKHDDPRLEEASKFFSRDNFEEEEDFEGKRKALKKIIKKKVLNRARSERPFKKKIGMSSFKKNFKRRKMH